MREILFKAKSMSGEWVEGFYFLMAWDGVDISCIGIEPLSANDYSEIYNSCYKEVVPETICQYTGINDINDNKIFEHDIVEFEDCGEDGFEDKDGSDFVNRAEVA